MLTKTENFDIYSIPYEQITCGIFLYNKDGKLLITKPTGNIVWSIPKGGMEKNETFFETAKRELFEETSIFLDNLKYTEPILLPPSKYPTRNKYLVPFIVHLKTQYTKDIVCTSMFDLNGKMIPENESYLWADLDTARFKLHNLQGKYLNDL
jgi:8-oxo-dGTP pyrophosphatase MutT (NUDIX family)